MKKYYIVCDISLCHDCNNCLMACKDEHVGNEWLPYTYPQPRHGHRWIDILRKERGQYPRIDVAYLPLLCQHCNEPNCVKENPGCVSRLDNGTVQIDAQKARGNKEIAGSCPYGAIYWNEENNAAQKCTMCMHILEGDSSDVLMPRCVHSCPTGALAFYHIEPEEMQKIIENDSLECYKPEISGGSPGVYYKNLYRYDRLFISGALLKDGECAEGVDVTLSGGGKTLRQRTDCFGDYKFDGLEPGEYDISVSEPGGGTFWHVRVDLKESVNLGETDIKSNRYI